MIERGKGKVAVTLLALLVAALAAGMSTVPSAWLAFVLMGDGADAYGTGLATVWARVTLGALVLAVLVATRRPRRLRVVWFVAFAIVVASVAAGLDGFVVKLVSALAAGWSNRVAASWAVAFVFGAPLTAVGVLLAWRGEMTDERRAPLEWFALTLGAACGFALSAFAVVPSWGLEPRSTGMLLMAVWGAAFALVFVAARMERRVEMDEDSGSAPFKRSVLIPICIFVLTGFGAALVMRWVDAHAGEGIADWTRSRAVWVIMLTVGAGFRVVLRRDNLVMLPIVILVGMLIESLCGERHWYKIAAFGLAVGFVVSGQVARLASWKAWRGWGALSVVIAITLVALGAALGRIAPLPSRKDAGKAEQEERVQPDLRALAALARLAVALRADAETSNKPLRVHLLEGRSFDSAAAELMADPGVALTLSSASSEAGNVSAGDSLERFIVAPPLNALARAGDFDIIVSDEFSPTSRYAPIRSSRELMRAARSRLAPKGLYVQAVRIAEWDDALIGDLLATAREEFVSVTIWALNPAAGSLSIALVCADKAPEIDLAAVDARLSSLAEELIGFTGALDVVARFICDGASSALPKAWREGAIVEVKAPLGEWLNVEADSSNAASWAKTLAALHNARRTAYPRLLAPPGLDEEETKALQGAIASRTNAFTHLLGIDVAHAAGDASRISGQIAQAAAADPSCRLAEALVISEARQLMSALSEPQALRKMIELTRRLPESAEARRLWAIAAGNDGRPFMERQILEDAARDFPENFDILKDLAMAQIRAKNIVRAIAALNEALRLRPDDESVLAMIRALEKSLPPGVGVIDGDDPSTPDASDTSGPVVPD